jgi:hypothetical protein
VLRIGRLGRHLVSEPAEAVDVALAAALRHERRAGPQRGVEVLEQRVVVLDPVEHGVREGGVDRLGELEVGQADRVEHAHARLAREALARLLDHRGRSVHRHHAAVRHALEQQLGHTAAAAARVEDGLRAGERQPPEDGQRHLDLGRGDAVVARRVPVAGAHRRPVSGPTRSRSPS